jgi:hypothetical protein
MMTGERSKEKEKEIERGRESHSHAPVRPLLHASTTVSELDWLSTHSARRLSHGVFGVHRNRVFFTFMDKRVREMEKRVRMCDGEHQHERDSCAA